MTYKIVKIEKENDQFVVEAEFYEDEEKVGQIKHAFLLEMSEDEIENEVRKSCELCKLEKEQVAVQKEKDIEEEKAKEVIEKLLNKTGTIQKDK